MRLLVLLLCFATPALAGTPLDAAVALAKAKRYPEARTALEQLVAAEPKNAAAWHELGIVWRARRDQEGYQHATDCFARASELDPKNEPFLFDYGATSLEYAGLAKSLTAATRGRAAVEKAVALAPDHVDARVALYQFYSQAPFLVGGSSSKAAAQLEEIRRRAPDRALFLEVFAKGAAKDYEAGFALCEAALRANPDRYLALYLYGRIALLSGTRLAEARTRLEKAATLPVPPADAPPLTEIWCRLGEVDQRLGRPDEARAAFNHALQLDPNSRSAKRGLEGLDSPPPTAG